MRGRARTVQAIALVVAWCGTASLAEAACPPTQVTVGEGTLTPAQRGKLATDLRAAAAKVCGWWGRTFSGALTVEVSESPGPSMALVPAWRGQRGQMLFRARVVRQGRAATVHEVVHVFAPNANRFLAEGLAVYAHEHLHGPVAYPNFGRSLHRAAQPYAARADIVALDRVATPAMLQGGGLGSREAYLVAGSFVRFLIERRGVATFRRLYARTPLLPGVQNAGSPARWLEIYGVPLEQLTAQWRARLSAGN